MPNSCAFNFHPVTRQSADASSKSLVPSLQGKLEFYLRRTNYQYLLAVAERSRSTSKWNTGSDFLFRCLIQALDLQEHENEILAAATPQKGRPRQLEKHAIINSLHEKEMDLSKITNGVREMKYFGQKDITKEAVRIISKKGAVRVESPQFSTGENR